MANIDKYISSSDNIIFSLEGQTGSGRTTLLLKWTHNNERKYKYHIIKSFIGAGKRTLSDVIIPVYEELKNIIKIIW